MLVPLGKKIRWWGIVSLMWGAFGNRGCTQDWEKRGEKLFSWRKELSIVVIAQDK